MKREFELERVTPSLVQAIVAEGRLPLWTQNSVVEPPSIRVLDSGLITKES